MDEQISYDSKPKNSIDRVFLFEILRHCLALVMRGTIIVIVVYWLSLALEISTTLMVLPILLMEFSRRLNFLFIWKRPLRQ